MELTTKLTNSGGATEAQTTPNPEQLPVADRLPVGWNSCQSHLPYAKNGDEDPSHASEQVTIGQKVTTPKLIAIRDINSVIEYIQTGIVEGVDIRAYIQNIRNNPDPIYAKELKNKLPWFTGSVCEGKRSNASVKFANFLIFDLDHVEDIEGTKKQAIKKLRFVLWAFRSVRDGVKLIACLGESIFNEDQCRILWRCLAGKVETALNIKVDATPDWSRACFFSYDPNLLSNPDWEPPDIEMLLEEAERDMALQAAAAKKLSSESYNPPDTTGYKPMLQGDEFERARMIVQNLAQMQIEYRDWIKIGMALYAGFGEGGKELWDMFLYNPFYQDTEADINRYWRSFASVHSITLETLFYMGEKYGCN